MRLSLVYDDSWFLSDLLNEYISSSCRWESGSLCGDILVVHFGVRLSRTTCCTTASIWYIWTILSRLEIISHRVFPPLNSKHLLRLGKNLILCTRKHHAPRTQTQLGLTLDELVILATTRSKRIFTTLSIISVTTPEKSFRGQKKTQFFHGHNCFKKSVPRSIGHL